MSPSQWYVLNRLVDLPAASAKELSAAVGVTGGTLTQTLRRLSKKGFVYVGSDPSDRRRKAIAITRTGKAALDAVTDAVAGAALPHGKRVAGAFAAVKGALRAIPRFALLAVMGLPSAGALADGAITDEQPCHDPYLAGDFKAARACFSITYPPNPLSPVFLALMEHNGEGVPADPAKAEAMAQAALPKQWSAELDTLVKVMAFLRFNPDEKNRKIDFCNDVAQSTATRTFCLQYAARRTEAALGGEIETLAKSLPEAARPAVAKARAAFDEFRKADLHLVFVNANFGETRDEQAAERDVQLLSGLLPALRRAAGFERPAEKTSDELKSSDGKLNAAYGKLKAKAAIGGDLRKAQRLWIRYRDACAALARAAGHPDAETALKTALTDERTGALEALALIP